MLDTDIPSARSSSTLAMANAIRALAMDAVQKANSGHPGAPMGMADMAVALWGNHLRHNPRDPSWVDRDRFVLSNGHASMLLYALLHLTGYDLPIKELQAFRQLGSKTPGHPEVGVTPGVETTTGPLGQGLANAVGMAFAEKLLAAEFNQTGHAIVDHHTYVFLGDGCLMEGISHEVCALAGVWKLNKLIALYDDNGISIDGVVHPWFGDDTAQRFKAYGWQVIGPVDGHDANAVDAAITQAKSSMLAPTLIICKTRIGKGAPNRGGTAKAHGEPLGAEEIALTREALGWSFGPFEVPQALYEAWDARARGDQQQTEWNQRFEAYAKAHPALAAEFKRRMSDELPKQFAEIALQLARSASDNKETLASRKASQKVLEQFTAVVPEMLGGSADLTGSNLTNTSSTPPVRFDENGALVRVDGLLGRHINYGVREFGMAAIMNGIALHGGHIPYGGTFLTFSDYSRNAIRMAALMKQRVIHVFTHDSIGLGEDGPTHQSVEHAASLRLIPNLDVWRPADMVEAVAAWTSALINKRRPTALLLSRQSLDYPNGRSVCIKEISEGAYVISDPAAMGLKRRFSAVLMASGSEVQIALQAQWMLAQEGIAVRVVSFPSLTVFERQNAYFKSSLLPEKIPRIVVDAGISDGWWKYCPAAVIGIDTYGESAPADVLFKFFGVTAENVAQVVKVVLKNRKNSLRKAN